MAPIRLRWKVQRWILNMGNVVKLSFMARKRVVLLISRSCYTAQDEANDNLSYFIHHVNAHIRPFLNLDKWSAIAGSAGWKQQCEQKKFKLSALCLSSKRDLDLRMGWGVSGSRKHPLAYLFGECFKCN